MPPIHRSPSRSPETLRRVYLSKVGLYSSHDDFPGPTHENNTGSPRLDVSTSPKVQKRVEEPPVTDLINLQNENIQFEIHHIQHNNVDATESNEEVSNEEAPLLEEVKDDQLEEFKRGRLKKW
jgi:hypothetical protein